MFYDIYCKLCEQRGLTPSGAAAKIGFNRASVTVWKNSGKAPKQDLLLRIADYFEVSVDFLLGNAEENSPAENGEREVDDDDIKFALFGTTEVDDALFEDVKKLAKTAMELSEKSKREKK